MTLNALTDDLIKRDLNWIADFELAAVNAADQVGLIAELKQTSDLATLSARTGIAQRALSAIVPVLNNAKFLWFETDIKPPQNAKRTERVVSLLKGGDAFLMGAAKSFTDMWDSGDIDFESAKNFSLLMFQDSKLPAQIHCLAKPFADCESLVDLGGGGGAWASESIKSHPQLRYTVFDLDNVCRATHQILGEKCPELRQPSFHAGNFFRDSLPPADAYLLSNILHDWEPNRCQELLRHIHASMPAHARLFINECLLTEDKSGPRFTSLFNLLMLLNHSSQQFSGDELSSILTDSGFHQPQIVSTAAHYSLLVSAKNPSYPRVEQ